MSAQEAAFAPPKGRLLTLVKKELWSLLVSPISYLIFLLFYLARGFTVVFNLQNFSRQGDVDTFAMAYLLDFVTYLMVVMVPPILTMRAFAEEKRTGSLELLMTAPVRDHEVVLGKWLATWIFYALLWLPTLLILVGLGRWLGIALPVGQVLASYLGLLSLGSLLLAVGLFASSLTDNQLLAALSSILFGIGLLVIPPQLAADGTLSVDSPFLWVLVDQANVQRHLQLWFFRGLIDTGHMVFYVSTTVLILFLTVRVVEARKWR